MCHIDTKATVRAKCQTIREVRRRAVKTRPYALDVGGNAETITDKGVRVLVVDVTHPTSLTSWFVAAIEGSAS